MLRHEEGSVAEQSKREMKSRSVVRVGGGVSGGVIRVR